MFCFLVCRGKIWYTYFDSYRSGLCSRWRGGREHGKPVRVLRKHNKARLTIPSFENLTIAIIVNTSAAVFTPSLEISVGKL